MFVGGGKVAGFGLDHNVGARIATRMLVKMAIGETAFNLALMQSKGGQKSFTLCLGAVNTQLTLGSLFTKLVAMGNEWERLR